MPYRTMIAPLTRSTVANAVAVTLVALAMVDYVSVLVLDQNEAARIILNDPGETLFHLAILPATIWLFVRLFPTDLWQMLNGELRRVAKLLAVVFVALAAWIALSDGNTRFCTKMIPPTDVANSSVRTDLLRLQSEFFSGAAVNREEQFSAYQRTLNSIRRPACDQWNQSSFRSKWATGLTFLGIVGGASILWLACVFMLAQIRPDDAQITMFIMVILFLLLWFPLRAYSEWYLNFKDLDTARYTPICVVAAVAVLLLSLFVFVLSLRESVAKAVLAGIGAFLGGALGIVAKLRPHWLGAAAAIYSSWDATALFTFNFLVALAVALMAWYFAA